MESHLIHKIEQRFLWCDSQIVLNWLSSTDKKPIFVENRFREICGHRDTEFQYVRTDDNPADLSTHPLTPDELKNSEIWWWGPEWLKKEPEHWPDELTANFTPEESSAPEIVLSVPTVPEPIIQAERFSCWTKLLQSMLFVLLFLSKCGKGKFFTDFDPQGQFSKRNRKKGHDL